MEINESSCLHVRDFDFKIQKNEKKRNYHLKFSTKLVRIDLRVCKKFNKHTLK